MTGVRVRFAPSPTGSLHLGNALTAVANRRFADERAVCSSSGSTTRTRRGRSTGGEEAILEDLAWLGVGFDEGPVRQSERGSLYADAAERALGQGGRARRRGRRAPAWRRHDPAAARRHGDVPARLGRRRSRSRDHARDPRLRSPPEPRAAAADRPRGRRRASGGDPPRARARPGREEALQAARALLDRRAARGGLPAPRRFAPTSTSSNSRSTTSISTSLGSAGSRPTRSRR